VPIPPLDGSKILFSLFPNGMYQIRRSFEQYGTFILIFFIFFLWQFLLPIVSAEFHLLTGLSF
jgi:Zn-dependent protease